MFLLFFDLYSSKDNFINDVSLTIGDWNSVHTAIVGSGPKPGHWNETDPLTGITVKFLKDFQFDAFYTLSSVRSMHLRRHMNVDLKLTCHDKFLSNKLVKGFSINPYFEMIGVQEFAV